MLLFLLPVCGWFSLLWNGLPNRLRLFRLMSLTAIGSSDRLLMRMITSQSGRHGTVEPLVMILRAHKGRIRCGRNCWRSNTRNEMMITVIVMMMMDQSSAAIVRHGGMRMKFFFLLPPLPPKTRSFSVWTKNEPAGSLNSYVLEQIMTKLDIRLLLCLHLRFIYPEGGDPYAEAGCVRNHIHFFFLSFCSCSSHLCCWLVALNRFGQITKQPAVSTYWKTHWPIPVRTPATPSISLFWCYSHPHTHKRTSGHAFQYLSFPPSVFFIKNTTKLYASDAIWLAPGVALLFFSARSNVMVATARAGTWLVTQKRRERPPPLCLSCPNYYSCLCPY